MKHIKYGFLVLASVLLIACSDSGREFKAADFVGRYKFELTFTAESDRAKHGSAVKDEDSFFTLGADYIAFGRDKQRLDKMTLQEVAGEKNLVLSVADKYLNLKIIDKNTLVLKTGPAIGTFSRIN